MKKLKNNKKVVFVMMSGGVDSSVAAFLLSESLKYKIVGCFIKGYNIDGCQEHDAEDARRTAEYLKIPFYVIDLEKEYKKLVVDYMIDGYRHGITPNPDVMCNKEIKFGLFLEKALAMGADYVATGHYVCLREIKNPAFDEVFNEFQNESNCSELTPIKIIASNNKMSSIISVDNFKDRGPAGDQTPETQVSILSSNHSGPTAYSLYQAKDKNKDQSYFLWTLTQKQLKHCLFPVGDYLKSEVREIARKAGLPTAEKKDSQGICFLGMVKFKDFLKQYLPVKKGDVLLALSNAEGETVYKKIGEHDGVWFYTIGQRHLGIINQELGIKGKHETKPFYVVEKDIKKNILMVAEGDDNPALYKKEIKLTNVNFISPIDSRPAKGGVGISILTRVRYRQPLAPAQFIIHNSKFIIKFDAPVKFVAPGQSLVFYNKEGEMLGGGVIV